MKSGDWLKSVEENADKLRSLILRWHPSRRIERGTVRAALDGDANLEITAPWAEKACRGIRDEIAAKDFKAGAKEPVERFDAALKAGDIGTLSELLSEAWFGVPESTDCWSIDGFAECVDLMDDPPED